MKSAISRITTVLRRFPWSPLFAVAAVVALTSSLQLLSQQATVSAQTPYLRGLNRTFAAQSATGATVSYDTFNTRVHTAQLVVTGSPLTCTYRLQGSNDATNWYDISGSDITCTSSAVQHVADKPSRYVRGNLLTLTGGTSPTVQLLYSGQ